MAKTVMQRRQDETPARKMTAAADKGARISANRRAKRPTPTSRNEAEQLYRPDDGWNANAPAWGSRLVLLNKIGLLHKAPPDRPITNLEAHELILDFYWPGGRS